MTAARRILFVFVDGVGLGEADAARNAMVDHMPRLTALLGVPPIAAHAPCLGPRALLLPLDATLGQEGLPQSGTGQAALLTGVDAVQLHGRHFGPWVPTRLRMLVRTRSVLVRARDAGHDVAFANAYPEEVLAAAEDPAAARRMAPFLRAGPPLAALGAGLLTRHTGALRRGDAVASEITNDGWRERLGRTDVPVIEPATAAIHLAGIAARHHLTLFAHYSTDYAGHVREIEKARVAIARFDAFLGALVDELPDDVMLIVASDHGNLEDATVGHTRNFALGIIAGTGFDQIEPRPARLTDIAPLILRSLGIAP